MAGCTTPSFVFEVKLQTNKEQENTLNKRFKIAGKVKNVVISHAQKKLNQLNGSKRYHELRQQYHELSEEIEKLKEKIGKLPEDTGEKRHKKTDAEKKLSEAQSAQNAIKKELNAMTQAVGLTKNDLEKFAKVQRVKYEKHLDAFVIQSIADDVYDGVKAVLYGTGRHLHHKAFTDIVSVQGKNNASGIKYRNGHLIWFSLDINAGVSRKDKYGREALKHRIKFCRIVRKMIGSRWHYYVQLVMEGTPPIKHRPGEGDVGIDNGPSVFSVVSDKEVSFVPLGIDTSDLDEKIVQTQQTMDRSRRAMNPDRFNDDGTIKLGKHGPWKNSHRYRVLRRKLKGLYERKARRKEMNAEIIANKILEKGDYFISEPLSYTALARRTKKTTINKKTGRPNSKKRFGKSISTNTPAEVEAALERKLGYFDLGIHRVNILTYRASQYNHIDDTYKKKTLKQRWSKIGDHWMQRDLYSAFLLRCPVWDLKSIDRELCVKHFNNFLKLHDAYINNLRNSDVQLPSCCGIHKEKKTA